MHENAYRSLILFRSVSSYMMMHVELNPKELTDGRTGGRERGRWEECYERKKERKEGMHDTTIFRPVILKMAI